MQGWSLGQPHLSEGSRFLYLVMIMIMVVRLYCLIIHGVLGLESPARLEYIGSI